MSHLTSLDEVSIEDYLESLYDKEPHIFLDVRELWEVEKAHIPSSRHIPLGMLENRLSELPKDGWIVTYCHYGMRSLRACRLLKDRGFVRVISLKGGIQRWSEVIDKTMPTY